MGLCSTECLTLSNAIVLINLAPFTFNAPLFFTSPFESDFVPNTPTIGPAPHVFPSRVVVRVAVHFDCFCFLPPFRASSLKCVSQCCQKRIWLWITSPSHSSPHAFGNLLGQEWQFHLCPNRSGRPCRPLTVPVTFSFSFLLNLNTRLMAFVSHLQFCPRWLDSRTNFLFWKCQNNLGLLSSSWDMSVQLVSGRCELNNLHRI